MWYERQVVKTDYLDVENMVLIIHFVIWKYSYDNHAWCRIHKRGRGTRKWNEKIRENRTVLYDNIYNNNNSKIWESIYLFNSVLSLLISFSSSFFDIWLAFKIDRSSISWFWGQIYRNIKKKQYFIFKLQHFYC